MPSAPARVYLFHGPDEFSAREAVRRLRAELDVSDANVVRLDEKATVADIASACHTATFFAEPRLVIIEGLNARFGGRRRGGAARGRGRKASAEGSTEAEQLADIFASMPESTTAVLLEKEPSAAMLETFKPIAKLQNFAIKRPQEVRAWAEARFKEQGASASAAAIGRLAENIDGHHLGEMAQEIDKLAAYAGGRRVEVQDVDEVGSIALQQQRWDFTDPVIQGRAGDALKALQRMDEREFPRQVLMSLLVRQYRQVLVAQAMLKEGLSTNQIGERLGIVHSFPLGKVIDQASRFPADRLDRSYRRLLETDAAIKTGVMDIDTALELLVVDLAQLAAGGRRGQPVGRS